MESICAKGFTFVGVSVDHDGPEVVKEFVKKGGMNHPQLMGSAEVFISYGYFEGIPTAFNLYRFKFFTIEPFVFLDEDRS